VENIDGGAGDFTPPAGGMRQKHSTGAVVAVNGSLSPVREQLGATGAQVSR
jgi:hypothetical protein